ncbi:protein phosphatase 1 regulatory subunit 3D-like [Xiphophorus maculatus]|uniref:protein phosphatase 1 regulatory subunit 3D-like n=1 Tax=Xiphophorus maculatus TaxID=8083 RepID=UPI0003B4368B|nr:protein phosphatase 1 regulatory subunit 3D-like [Xiphophorus maculatus]
MSGSAGEQNWRQAQVIAGPSRLTSTIRLRDIYNPKPPPPKAQVRIRPPSPRPASLSERGQQQTPSDDPSVQRKRAQSLSSASGKKREPRRVQVRFVDALGLDLEEVKVFRRQEDPLIPPHVMFRLLMSSELTFGKSPELNMPYFRPCFPEHPGGLPNFQNRLCSQKVSLESVMCSDQGITGTVHVLNLAYQKEVKVHYSFTNWRTQTHTTALWVWGGYPGDCGAPGTDVFRFRLPVPPFILQPGAILEFAICYRVNGWDFWDNNDGNNYKLACHSYKVTVPRECEDSLLHFT